MDPRIGGSDDGRTANRPSAKPPFVRVLTIQALTLLLLWLLQARYG